MNTQTIRILACIVTGCIIYEAKAEDYIDFTRISSLYADEERQGPIGIMDLNLADDDFSRAAWHLSLRHSKDDYIAFDAVLPNRRLPGNAKFRAGPLSDLAAFIHPYTNRPGDEESDVYSLILDLPPMYTIPQFVGRDFGLAHRDAMRELSEPWVYNKAKARGLTETVPEPMAFGLIAISGIGLLFARRMFRKI